MRFEFRKAGIHLAVFITLCVACCVASATAFSRASFAQAVVRFDPVIVPVRDEPQRSFYSMQGFSLKIEVSVQGGTQAELSQLEAYLENLANYEFTSDWPAVDNLLELNTENPPFTPSQAPAMEPILGEAGRFNITVRGFTRGGTRGEVRIRVPSQQDGVPYAFQMGGQAVQDRVILRYKSVGEIPLPAFRGRGQLGFAGGGPSFDFSGSGVLRGRAAEAGTITSLSVAAKLPLRRPDDVRATPGAERDASRDVADAVEVSLNRTGYRRGGNPQRLGIKARTTGSLHGLELVGYYSPLTGWYDQSRGFYALEIEAGYRRGDAEFVSLTTRAPARGSVVARVGSVIEWAPQLGGVNRNLRRGLRFFVRGRGWLDTYKNSGGDYSLRFRPFMDAELFFNFSDDNRIFLRGEYGSLPPDLTGRSSRVYIGAGRAF